MIQLTRMNGRVIAINPDLVTWIDVTPDTSIALLNGDHIMVRESLDEVLEKVIEFKRTIRMPFSDPDEAIQSLDTLKVAVMKRQQSIPPSLRPSESPRRGER
jgi:flagellar protein FlbD